MQVYLNWLTNAARKYVLPVPVYRDVRLEIDQRSKLTTGQGPPRNESPLRCVVVVVADGK